MKLARFDSTRGDGLGVVLGDEIADIRSLAPGLSLNPVDILSTGPAGYTAVAEAVKSAPRYKLSDVRLLAPVVRPGKVLGIGLNYRDHAKETGREPPTTQMWFSKQATSVNDPFSPIAMPAVSTALDYEVELVVVIGKRCRFVPRDRVNEVIAGYMVGNDVSVRDWQRATPTMMMGKGFDTHAPVGPWITTPDEVGDPQKLKLTCTVNGEVRQNASTADMIFDVAAQIEHLTKAMTLEPGDLLFTGTPAGVGVAFTPPKFMKIGDRVRVEVEKLGHIEALIEAEDATTRIG
jgi:2-keto-4-pentenoate hydratase/2-oxohepta-3-ene-1,7-dioic acid hydratase in catechol pathway